MFIIVIGQQEFSYDMGCILMELCAEIDEFLHSSQGGVAVDSSLKAVSK